MSRTRIVSKRSPPLYACLTCSFALFLLLSLSLSLSQLTVGLYEFEVTVDGEGALGEGYVNVTVKPGEIEHSTQCKNFTHLCVPFPKQSKVTADKHPPGIVTEDTLQTFSPWDLHNTIKNQQQKNSLWYIRWAESKLRNQKIDTVLSALHSFITSSTAAQALEAVNKSDWLPKNKGNPGSFNKETLKADSGSSDTSYVTWQKQEWATKILMADAKHGEVFAKIQSQRDHHINLK